MRYYYIYLKKTAMIKENLVRQIFSIGNVSHQIYDNFKDLKNKKITAAGNKFIQAVVTAI